MDLSLHGREHSIDGLLQEGGEGIAGREGGTAGSINDCRFGGHIMICSPQKRIPNPVCCPYLVFFLSVVFCFFFRYFP